MKLNITLLIPLLLIVSTLFASLLLYIKRDHEANDTIRSDALSNMNLDITRLQNILYNLLTERADNLKEAKLNLSVIAMDSSIRTLLLSGDDHSVIIANRYMWEGKHAGKISSYDANKAKQAVQNNTPKTFFDAKNNTLLMGYYPVVLQLQSDSDLSKKRMGVLYTEVSIANKLAFAKNKATTESMVLAGVMLMVAGIVALLLHFMVSVRLTKLTRAVDKFSWGDHDSSLSISGNDELTVAGNAFNEMAKQIKQDIWRHEEAAYNLLHLNKTLEQRVEDRTKELEFKKQELLDTQAYAHHANKMTALGEMASGIAHEINSPLQIVSILTYNARKNAQKLEPIDIEAITEKIDHATNQITSIVESLRKMSRDSSSDSFEETKVSDIIEDATKITLERYKLKSINFKTNYHDDAESALFDCQRLQISQIIINLLNNAYDAVQKLTDKWIVLDVFNTKNSIMISVTDSGSGIDKNIQKQVFEPMFTTKDIGQGTGLGLSISSEIALNHSGTLELDTESEYTRFVLILPKSHINQNTK